MFIPFPVPHKDICIDKTRYTILENHLTVFSDYTDYSKNSEYHYTATLEDTTTGEQYKLRCYFDKSNLASDNIFLKPLTAPGTQVESLSLSPEMHLIIKMWIQAAASTIISPLAIEQHKKISNLIDIFDSELTPLLVQFDNDNDTIEALVTLRTQTTRLLKKEKQIVQLDPEFKSILLSTLNENIEWRIAEITTQKTMAEQLQTQAASSPETSTEPPVEIASGLKKKNSSKKKKPSKNQKNAQKVNHSDIVDDFISEFTQLQQRYKKCPPLTDKENLAESIMHLSAEMNGLVCRLELLGEAKEKKMLSLPIETIKEDSAKKTKALMHAAIESNNPEVLKTLGAFTKLIPLSFLQYAIDTNNSDLMNIAFTNHSYAINRLMLTLPESGVQVSPLIYAYEKKAHCAFETLLNHSANPFVTAEDNLPLIHHILKKVSDKHFFPVMYAKIFELGHVPIIKQLINTVEEELKTNTQFSKLERDSLNATLSDYKSMLISEKDSSFKINHKIRQSDAKLSSELSECISETLLKTLESDQEYLQVKAEFINAQRVFKCNLTQSEFYKFNSIGKSILSDSLNNKALIESAMSRESLLVILRSHTIILPKRTRLMQIQKISGNPRSVKAGKQLQSEATTLEHEIKLLQAQVESAAEKQLFDSSLSKARDELKGLLAGLTSLLKDDQDFSSSVEKQLSSTRFLGNANDDDDDFFTTHFDGAFSGNFDDLLNESIGKSPKNRLLSNAPEAVEAPPSSTMLLAQSMEKNLFSKKMKQPLPLKIEDSKEIGIGLTKS